LVTSPLLVWGQGRPAATGNVSSPTGTAVELATVTLHRAADSVVVKSEFSDAAGAFRLEGAPARYVVSVMQVGFEHYWSAPFELVASDVALPAIRLAASRATALNEVTVTSRKPLFERQADRTVVNVAYNSLSAGATALDVLARSPGVIVYANNNIALKGRTAVLVVIDGKRTPLTGTDLADYLRSLPAEQLQSIELITNPPAQFDAQGGAGVIAINLKKDERQGTNGSVNASYGRGEYGKFTTGASLNHRHKRTNLYGTYAYTNRLNFLRLDFERQYAASPLLPAGSSELFTDRVSDLRSHTGKLGLDVTLSQRTLVGVSVSGLTSQTYIDTDNTTRLFGPNRELTTRFNSVITQDVPQPSGSANVNLRHAFADSATARTLTADADYARYKTTRLLDLYTFFAEPSAPTNLFSGDQSSDLTIQAVKVDFSQPLPHRARLETGVKMTRVSSDNNVLFVNTANGITTTLPNISTNFQYNENVNAAYVSLRGASPKTTYRAGLRAEQTNTSAQPLGENARKRNYTQLFPSLILQRTLSAQHTLGLSVARRIDRPSYVQVNPIRNYFDATSYRSGNPDLVAQTSYNVDLTHTFRQKFSTSLAYAQTDKPIVTVVQLSPDGGRLVVNRDVNLSTQHNYSLTLTAPLELAKWWTLYANGVFYYSRFKGELASTVLDRDQAAFNLSANNSFTLPHGWGADLNGVYESRERYFFETNSQRGQVSVGLQKSLWNKQGTLRLNVSDIFYTTPVTSTTTFNNFAETFYRRQDTRVATVAFTYRFGNSKVAAARKRSAGAEDELRRANGQ
jgi:hypothetical protein